MSGIKNGTGPADVPSLIKLSYSGEILSGYVGPGYPEILRTQRNSRGSGWSHACLSSHYQHSEWRKFGEQSKCKPKFLHVGSKGLLERPILPSECAKLAPPFVFDSLLNCGSCLQVWMLTILYCVDGVKSVLWLIWCLTEEYSGYAVTQLLDALRYKLEGRGFDSRWCHWNFHWRNPSDRTMALGLNQKLTEMSTRNISWGVKAAGA